MLYDNMDLSRLMVHVQQVEDSRNKRGVRDVRRRKTSDQEGQVIVVTGTTSPFVSSPDSKRGIRVWEILTLRGVQHLEK